MSGADGTRMGGESVILDENENLDSDHPVESSRSEDLSARTLIGDRKILNAESGAHDPIALALANAITEAVGAGRFDVLPALAAELAARRT
jgi:hypothetical protein